MAYVSNSGRMTRDWYFVTVEIVGEDDERLCDEASCVQEARQAYITPIGCDVIYTLSVLRKGKFFEEPITPAFEVIEEVLVRGTN